MIYKFYKKEGETPLMALKRFAKENGLQGAKLSYANRLDPLASGVMLALDGEDLKRKEKIVKTDKEYDVEVLFGVKTDSGDLLGNVLQMQGTGNMHKVQIKGVVENFVGEVVWEYPIFSSKTYKGRKLFDWYLKGEMEKVADWPKYKGCIKEIEFQGGRRINADDLLKVAMDKLCKVQASSIKESYADFGVQDKIAQYKKLLSQNKSFIFTVAKIKVRVTSGVFIRTLAEKLGESLNTPALTLKIERTKIFS